MKSLIVLCLLAGTVHAQEVEAFVSLDHDASGGASIEATLIGAPPARLDKITLSTESVTVRANKLRSYTEGTESLGVGLVVSGDETWTKGALKDLESAIDKFGLGTAGPPGSKGFAITYAAGADIRVPAGALNQLVGKSLGTLKDYKGKRGADLVQGITLGIAELSKLATARKALVVIGDGYEASAEAIKGMADLKNMAAAQQIEIFAIVIPSSKSSGSSAIMNLVPHPKTVKTSDAVVGELTAILGRLADRIYVSFPSKALPLDGKPHTMIIKLGDVALEPVTLTLQ